jgi:arylsulfatase A-like enzyme
MLKIDNAPDGRSAILLEACRSADSSRRLILVGRLCFERFLKQWATSQKQLYGPLGRMNLRLFISFLVLVGTTFAGNAPTRAADVERRNILFIFADDHTTQALSAYGHPMNLVETPNLDRIASQGMLFKRCMVTNSICGPSRAVILTGKYSHLNGFTQNGDRFDGGQTTFPKLLQGVGYQTAIIGKWHLESDPTGFDHWHILPGQGQYYNPPMIRDGQPVEHEGYATDIITELSIEWLRKRDKTRPFMLMSQHKAPHGEWAPALRHLGWNGERVFPEPETLFDDYSGRGPAEREQAMSLEKSFTDRLTKLTTPPYLNAQQREEWEAYYGPRNAVLHQAKLTGRELVRWRYQRYMHDYLGTVLAVDESVGRLLDFLDQEGLSDSTLVIYCSDQGFYLG